MKSRSAFAPLLLLCATLATLSPPPAMAARRALVVGIDTYSPPAGQRSNHHGRSSWQDLQGAAADAGAIHALLLARYGFEPDQVRLLQDRQATREAILDGLRQHLGGAQPGDTAFFFYAGHGSQVKNSKSAERNKLDESLVPSDSWTGVPDIRDKELAREFVRLLDAGIRVVVILDSCHSGSASRGAAGTADKAGLLARKIHPSAIDAADDYRPASRAGKDFLALSAAQDHQLAWEAWAADGTPRGLFSLALQRAMQSASPDEPVDVLFRRVQSAIAATRGDQDPVIEGDPVRLKKPLFGDPPADALVRPAQTLVGLVSLGGDDGRGITLGAGSAIGLTVGTVLGPLTKDSEGTHVEVTALLGPTRATARLVKGRLAGLKGGMLLAVRSWGAPPATALRVHVPTGRLAAGQLRGAAAAFRSQADAHEGVTWVDDPTTSAPTHSIAWRDGGWVLSSSDSVQPITPTQDLAKATGSGARVFLNLPPPGGLAAVLRPGAQVAVVSAGRADYHLVGRWVAGRLEYAWVRPWAGGSGGVSTTLPSRTDWFNVTRPSFAARELAEGTERLARIHHWLTTDGPPSEGTFPYQLAIFDADTQDRAKAYRVSGTIRQGTRYNLALVATRPLGRGPIEPRYVYVFVIDKDGKSTVILPYPGKGDVENLFPPPAAFGQTIRAKAIYKLLEEDIAWVAPPFGTDTYVMLTTKTKLSDPSILEWSGVRTRGASFGPGPKVLPDWSIQRVVVTSAPR